MPDEIIRISRAGSGFLLRGADGNIIGLGAVARDNVMAAVARHLGLSTADTDPDFREVGEPAGPAMAEIRMTPEAAYRLASELADLLGWAKGFNAARAPDASADDRAPCLDRLRDVRSLLLSAANEARGVKDADLPF